MAVVPESVEANVTKDAVFYPPHLWGLDFHFNSFNKLYICDILHLKPYPSFPGAFAYGNHPVYKVDVVGVVVRTEERQKLFLHSVDDGTGVVNCCCWKQPLSSVGIEYAVTSGSDSLPAELQLYFEQLDRTKEAGGAAYQLGDLVQIRGKLKMFRDMIEIVASNHRRLDNPTSQTNRMLELPHLYRNCYDKPFVPPYKVQQEIARLRGGGSRMQTAQKQLRQHIHESLKECITRFLQHHKLSVFSILDLTQDADIANIVTSLGEDRDVTTVLEQCLQVMEDEVGTVCHRRRSSPPYENLTGLSTSQLEQQIMSTLRKECTKPAYREKGCHYLHVHDELLRTAQYCRLSRVALLHALQRLETGSDVIRVTDRCYMPLS